MFQMKPRQNSDVQTSKYNGWKFKSQNRDYKYKNATSEGKTISRMA